MACKCNVTIQELGLPSCTQVFGLAKYLIFTMADDFLSIPDGLSTNADLIAQDFTTGNLNYWSNNPDEHLTPRISNFVWTKEDAVVESLDDGTPIFVRDGRVSLEWVFVKAPAGFLRYLKQLRCVKNLGMYIVDTDGRVWGLMDLNANVLRPIPILSDSFDFKLLITTPTTAQKVSVKVTLDFFLEENLRGIGESGLWDTYTPPIPTVIKWVGWNNVGADARVYADLLVLFGSSVSLNMHLPNMVTPANWLININGTTYTPSVTEIPVPSPIPNQNTNFVAPEGIVYQLDITGVNINAGDNVMVSWVNTNYYATPDTFTA